MFLSQLRSQPTISWVAFAWPDGSFFAGHKLGDGVIEMLEITARPQDPDRSLRICRQRSQAQGKPGRGHQLFRHRSGMVSRGDAVQRRTLDDADHASQRRSAGGRVLRADRHRQKPRRRHRHHHRTDAGLEFPVAAHGRKIGRRLHPRPGRQGVAAPDPSRRGDAAEDRPSAVSGRGRCDPQRRAPTIPAKASRFTPGDAGRQSLSGGADADLVSGLVAGDSRAGIGISRPGADDDPEFADRPRGADRVCRIAVGMARPAPDRRTPDQGGERDQACRALRSGQGAAASVAADRDRKSLRRHRRHGAGARRVPEIHPGRSGEAADQRRQWRAARRRGTADERDVHRSRRLYRHVGAARRPHHSAAVALFRRRLGADPGAEAAPSTNSSAMP